VADVHRAFVFRNRRWILAAIYIIGFAAYPLDRASVAQAIARFLSYHSRVPADLWLHGLVGLAAVLISVGALWRTWGTAYLGADVVFDRQLHSERLLADGPYRRTRNPLYFGNLLLSLGLGFIVSPLGWPVIVLGMWLVVRLLIRDEEAGLTASHGESYGAYLAAVPRLFPSFRPVIPAAGARPRWAQGICGEGFLWALTLLTAGMAVSLNQSWYQMRMFWAFTIALPFVIWSRRRRRTHGAPSSAEPAEPPA
jgi:protein-S-isoprenylcysteine O-methyltransferase Ste14